MATENDLYKVIHIILPRAIGDLKKIAVVSEDDEFKQFCREALRVLRTYQDDLELKHPEIPK